MAASNGHARKVKSDLSHGRNSAGSWKAWKQLEGQLSLFNEAEAEMNPETSEPIIVRRGCLYKRKAKTSREELLKDLPVEEFPCVLHPDDM